MDNNVQSFYNEGFFQIQRLNMLKLEANNAAKAGDFERWRWVLDTIWRELTPDIIKASHFKTYNDKLEEENEYFIQWRKHQDAMKESNDRLGLYRATERYEMFIRSVQEVFGKGGRHIDPNERSMD